LDGCETLSILLNEKQRHKVLRRIFGPKNDKETWEWRRLHNGELYNLYSSPNNIRIIKKNEMTETCSTYGRQECFI
jgi:hypothetical protein